MAVVCGQLLQGGKHIGHHYAAVVHFVVRVADYAKGSPLLQGLWGKGVAVEGLPFESEEEASGGYMPRVGSDGAGLQIGLI